MKNGSVFLLSAQNTDCGYSLESPYSEAVITNTNYLCVRAKQINELFTPVNPSFIIYSVHKETQYVHFR